MAFEIKKMKVFRKIVLPKTQIQKECEIEIGIDISKILSATSAVSLISSEVKDGEILYTAQISSCVIYLTNEMEIGSANSICEYSGKINDSHIKEGDKTILSLSVKDSNIDFSNACAIIKLDIEEMVELFVQKEVKTIDSFDDDICTQKGNMVLEKFHASAEKEVFTEDEFAVKKNIKKIISLESSAIINDCETEKNMVTVTGETLSRVVYLTDDDKFEDAYVKAAFKEEVEVENTEEKMKAICKANVDLKNSVTELLESDKGTKISVKIPLRLNLYIFSEEEIDVVEDLYSTQNEIALSSESFDMTKICKSENLESKIDGSLVLSDEKPRIDKIIFNGGNSVNVTNSYIENKELFVEGIVKTTVVYLNDDEGTLNSVEIEIPFVSSDKIGVEGEAVACVDAVLYDVDVSVKRGREIMFDGKVKMTARICYDEISATITSAEKGEEFIEKDCAMMYVFGKTGESLWSVAKRNKIKQEQLIAQNSDVSFPLIQDTGFILFFQKTL